MASPVITQHTTCGSVTTSASTGSFAFSDAATQLICVVAHASRLSTPPTNLGISDTAGLTWTLRRGDNVGNIGGFSAYEAMWVWTAPTGGAVTTNITITNADTGGKEAVCFGLKGLGNAGAPLDTSGIQFNFATSGAPTLASYNTTQNDDLITLFAMGITDPGATLSPAGYTLFATVNEGDGFSYVRGFDKSVSAPQVGASATSPTASLGYMVMVPFTADSSAPPVISKGGHVSQMAVLTPYAGPGGASLGMALSAMSALVVYAPGTVRYVRASQMLALVPYAAADSPPNIPRVSQMGALVVWGGNLEVEGTSRAWAFVMDGHPMYVLDLGQEGTFIYDIVSKQWCKFQTSGHIGWNMRNGTVWGSTNRILGGDSNYPYVWEMVPDEIQDEGFRTVTHAVTGGITTRSRTYMSVSALRLAASAGLIMADSGATLTMKFSDDNGKTWSKDYVIDLTALDFKQELAWRSLGSFKSPGRIFDISDDSGMLRIDGADVYIDGFDDPPPQPQGGGEGGDKSG